MVVEVAVLIGFPASTDIPDDESPPLCCIQREQLGDVLRIPLLPTSPPRLEPLLRSGRALPGILQPQDKQARWPQHSAANTRESGRQVVHSAASRASPTAPGIRGW